jgi:hypothetical protein
LVVLFFKYLKREPFLEREMYLKDGDDLNNGTMSLLRFKGFISTKLVQDVIDNYLE